MNLAGAISEAEALIDWLDTAMDDVSIASTNRHRLAAQCLDNARETHQTIVVLAYQGVTDALLSLIGSCYQACVEGLWLRRCASEAELEAYARGWLNRSVPAMVADLTRTRVGYADRVLSMLRAQCSCAQTSDCGRDEPIEVKGCPDELDAMIQCSNMLAILACASVGDLAESEALGRFAVAEFSSRFTK